MYSRYTHRDKRTRESSTRRSFTVHLWTWATIFAKDPPEPTILKTIHIYYGRKTFAPFFQYLCFIDEENNKPILFTSTNAFPVHPIQTIPYAHHCRRVVYHWNFYGAPTTHSGWALSLSMVCTARPVCEHSAWNPFCRKCTSQLLLGWLVYLLRWEWGVRQTSPVR